MFYEYQSARGFKEVVILFSEFFSGVYVSEGSTRFIANARHFSGRAEVDWP
jgi:hypothetical protein